MDMEGGYGGGIHTSESDVDLKAMAEKELARMKRQYFLMQRNRQSVMEKAGSKSVRSDKLVKLLETQKDNLEADLTAAKSSMNQRKDEETKTRIWKLLQVYEKYKVQIEKLQNDIYTMDKTLSVMTSKFYKAKLRIQAVLGCAVDVGRLERTIENHETKLHNVRSQYDTLMTENRELKDEIATKISRRMSMFTQMSRLQTKMTDCRRTLNSSVDEALSVYNDWEDAARKISFIKEKYKEEVRQHLLEMKEYDRLLFHDLREIRFYSTKNKPRPLLEEAAQREERKSQKEIGTLQQEVRKYKNQFMRLEEFDPLQNVDAIITNYKSLEQKNFGYFQQISDFNRESNQLMEEIHELKNELDQLAAEKDEREKMNDQELKKLELSRDTEQQRLLHVQAQLDVTDESTKRIVEAMETFFVTAECDLEPLRDLLGKNEHITTKNLRNAFNLLEQHIASIQLEKELLAIQKDVETRTTPLPIKPPKIQRAAGGPFQPNIVISGRPELGMEKKDDEEDLLFATARIPKSVQREHLFAQLRDLGIITSPKVITASESAVSLPMKGGRGKEEKDKGQIIQIKPVNVQEEDEQQAEAASESPGSSPEEEEDEEEEFSAGEFYTNDDEGGPQSGTPSNNELTSAAAQEAEEEEETISSSAMSSRTPPLEEDEDEAYEEE